MKGMRRTQLRGRDPEIAFLCNALVSAESGRGTVCFIEGDGGIGKSRLVQEIGGRARTLGFEVHIGGAEEIDRVRPFGAVAHALTAFRHDLPRLWERGEGVDRSSDAMWLGDTVLDALESRAVSRPLFVCIEDLHWADEETWRFASAAVRRVEGIPIVFIASTRPVQEINELAHVVDRAEQYGASVLRLAPLDGEAVNDIARDVLGADPGPTLRAQLSRAAGSPFYVVELLSALHDEGAISSAGGTADVRSTVLPPSLRLTILRRLSALPSDSFDDLRIASLLGSSFDIDDVTLVTGRSSIELLKSFTPALRAGFLLDMAGRLVFRHDLVRSAIYEDVPPAIRRGIHRQIGRAFAASGRDALAVATHMALSADVGDAEAIDWLIRAADTARNETKADLLQRAADLCESGDPRRAEMLARRVFALVHTFRGQEAERLARQLIEETSWPEGEPLIRSGLAMALTHLGRYAEARSEWILIRNDERADDVARAHASAELAGISTMTGNINDAQSFAEQAVAEGTRLDEPYVRAVGLMTLSSAAGARGDLPAAICHGDAAATWGDRTWETGQGLPTVRIATAAAALAADRFDEAAAHLHVGYARSEAAQMANVSRYQVALALIKYSSGDWDEALVEAQSVIEYRDEERTGILVALAVAARICAHQGDIDSAEQLLVQGAEEVEAQGPAFGSDLFLWAQAGGTSATSCGYLDVFESTWDLTEQIRYLFGLWRMIWPDLVRTAVSAGRTQFASKIAVAADVAAERAEGIGSVDAAALRIKGVAYGDPASAVGAADAFRGSPRRVEAAGSCEDAGLVLKAGADDRATAYLLEAAELYDSLGAVTDANRVYADLRSMGFHRGARGRRARPKLGWESLTPTELRVIHLVAEGMTNAAIGERYYISRRTVQTHLRNVFGKLGVKSRAEVAAEVARRSA